MSSILHTASHQEEANEDEDERSVSPRRYSLHRFRTPLSRLSLCRPEVKGPQFDPSFKQASLLLAASSGFSSYSFASLPP